MKYEIDNLKLDEVLSATLLIGSHTPNDSGRMCFMEAAAYIAGEPWSDNPACTCPVIASFGRAWNDALSDEDRNRLLKPMVSRVVGTRGSDALAERRALMAADWLVREHTPAWLRLAKHDAQAALLEALPEITSMAQMPSIRGPIEAARQGAAAAGDAARAAAWAAARDAARAAAGAALRPTQQRLQESALALLVRMIEVRDATHEN